MTPESILKEAKGIIKRGDRQEIAMSHSVLDKHIDSVQQQLGTDPGYLKRAKYIRCALKLALPSSFGRKKQVAA